MDIKEFDTFIQQFKQLWKSCHSAHLDIDSYDGQAWVGLRVRLVQAPGPFHQGPPQHKEDIPSRTRNGPSRQRRQAMRSAERVRREAEEASNGEPKETGNVEIVNEAEEASHKEIETLDNEKQVNQEVIAEIAVDETNTTEDEALQETADSDDNMIVATPIGAVEPVHDMLPDNPPVPQSLLRTYHI